MAEHAQSAESDAPDGWQEEWDSTTGHLDGYRPTKPLPDDTAEWSALTYAERNDPR